MSEKQILQTIKEKLIEDRSRYKPIKIEENLTEKEDIMYIRGVMTGRSLYIYEMDALIKVGEDTE